MQKFIVKSLKNQMVIADKCVEAASFSQRLFGLIGKGELAEGEAMWFPRCQSIHMWFMRIPLDVVFLARVNAPSGQKIFRVSKTVSHLKPWQLFPVFDYRSDDVLELAAGSVHKFSLEVGDEVCIT